MKRYFSIFLLAILCLTGCSASGSSENTTTEAVTVETDTTTGGKEQTSEAGACIINDVTIVPGKDFAEAKAALGEPAQYVEAASCYFDGMDKVYTYKGFEITTYPVGDKDYVQNVCISSDKYETPEGITVGSALDEVTAAYGDSYELTGKMYKYFYNENTYMYFFIMDEGVKYFGYAVNPGN